RIGICICSKKCQCTHGPASVRWVASRVKPIVRKEGIMKHDVSSGGTTMTAPPKDKSFSGKPPADQDEIRKKVEAAATPGPAHKALEALIGDWKAEVKCWMEPGQPPHVSQG